MNEEHERVAGNAVPPEGVIPLGRLIESLMSCLDESGVSEGTLVQIGPEFGRLDRSLFASGAAVTYPAGSGWVSYEPFVIIEYRKGIR